MEIIHLDTIYSTYQGADAFSARFQLTKPIINPKKIYFKSLEMPINIYNIRSQSNLNLLTIKLSNNSIYNLAIPEGNYTAIADILSAIRLRAIAVLPSNLNLTVTLVANKVKLLLADTAILVTSFEIVPTNFSQYILGFRKVSISNALNIVGVVDFNINVDNYIYLQIINLKSEIVENSGNLNIQFKIPLNAVSQMIYYTSDLTSMTQSIRFTGIDIITYLQINILDRFGTPLSSTYNSDYSLSLGVEYNL